MSCAPPDQAKRVVEEPDAAEEEPGGRGGGGAGGRGGMAGGGAGVGGAGGTRVDAAVDVAPDAAVAVERAPVDMVPDVARDAGPEARPEVGPPPTWAGPATPILVVVGNGGRRMFSTEIKLVDMAGVQRPQVTFNDTRDEAINTGLSPKDLKEVLYADHQVIAVGGHAGAVDSSSRIMTFDGKDWKDVANVPTGQGRLDAVAFGNGIWVAAGKLGVTLRSLDHGKTWEATGLNGKPCCIRDIAFGRMAGKDVFVAVADGYAIVKSEDGLVWDMINPSNNDFSNGFKSVAFGGDAAVTVGGPDATGRKYRFDGKVAANDMIAGPGLHTVLFVDNKFSAYGNMNTMFTSGDGVNWTMMTTVNSGTTVMFQANLTIKNLMNMDTVQKLFITRSSTTVKTSPDGLMFTNVFTNPQGENSLTSVTLATGM